MIETDYKEMDRVETPHGNGTVADVGAVSPWGIDYPPSGHVYVWVVLDKPFRPLNQKLYNCPRHWCVRGGWDAVNLRKLEAGE